MLKYALSFALRAYAGTTLGRVRRQFKQFFRERTISFFTHQTTGLLLGYSCTANEDTQYGFCE